MAKSLRKTTNGDAPPRSRTPRGRLSAKPAAMLTNSHNTSDIFYIQHILRCLHRDTRENKTRHPTIKVQDLGLGLGHPIKVQDLARGGVHTWPNHSGGGLARNMLVCSDVHVCCLPSGTLFPLGTTKALRIYISTTTPAPLLGYTYNRKAGVDEACNSETYRTHTRISEG